MVKIVYAFFYAISLLPFRLLYCIADFEYFMMYRVIKYRRGIVRKSGKIPGEIDPELVELAKKQGREFTDVDAHTLLTNALDDFKKEMDENGWEYGQDDEELFELAMHPEQYRNYKSGR